MARCKASPALPLQAPPVAPSRRGGGSTDDLGYATKRVLALRRNRSGSAAAPLPLRGADHVTSRRSTAERLRWSISGETNWRRIPTTTFDCKLKEQMTSFSRLIELTLCHCFHCSQIHGKRWRTFRMPAPRDRQHNRRDAIANVVIDWQAPLVGFSSPSDFNPITWSPGPVCCLARSEVRA